MKKIFSIILICFWSFNLLVAQETCITPSPLPPSWIFQKSPSQKSIQLNSVSSVITLNIFVHIVRSTNGQGLNTSILSTILSNLNNSFTSSNIKFSLAGSDYIDNDNFYGNLVGKENQLFGINIHTNAINIYVLGTSTNWGAAGMAQSIPSTAYIVHGNYYNTSSLPHEMGHCLGLYHTHHGTVTETGGDINQCSELVNGSNSTTCGDYISDTRADPNVWSSNSCNYSGTLTDVNGQFYNPDPSNLMSYSYKPCRNLFTPLQSDRMNNFILNTQILQNVIHYEISGSPRICNQDTYTINNLPTGSTVNWSSIPSGVVTFQANGDSVILTKNGSGGIITLTAQITVNGTTSNLSKENISVGQPFMITEESTLGLKNIGGDAYQIIAGSGNYKYTGKLVVNDYYGIAISYSWAKVGGSTTLPINWSASNNSVSVYTKTSGQMLRLSCTASNSCGSYTKNFTFYSGISPLLAIYPNPATTSVTVTLNEEAETSATSMITSTTTKSNNYDIQLWNSTSLVKTISTDQKITQVSLNGLQRGIYYLHLIKNKEIIEKQILIVN